jgi:hypothetical protein
VLLDDENEGSVGADDLDFVGEARDRVPAQSHLRQVDDLSSVADDEPAVDRAPARLDEAERPPPDSKDVRQRRERTIAVDLARILVGELCRVVVVQPPLGGAGSVAKVVGRRLEGPR